ASPARAGVHVEMIAAHAVDRDGARAGVEHDVALRVRHRYGSGSGVEIQPPAGVFGVHRHRRDAEMNLAIDVADGRFAHAPKKIDALALRHAADESGVGLESAARVSNLDAVVTKPITITAAIVEGAIVVDAKLRARTRTQLGIDDTIRRIDHAQR